MRTTRAAAAGGQALHFATESAVRNPYICRACLSQTTTIPTTSITTSISTRRRHLSTTPQFHASSSEPFYKRIQSTLFGRSSKTSQAAEGEAAERKKQLVEKIKADREAGEGSETTTTGREKVELFNGEVFEVAEMVDPVTHAEYVVSRDWKGLERVGGEGWVRGRADGGERYVGFTPAKPVKLSKQEWEVLLHTITAEVLTLRNAGRDVLQVCNPRRSFDAAESEQHPTRGVVVSDAQGAPVLSSGTQETAILASISEATTNASSQEDRAPEVLEAELTRALASGGGKMFMAFKLDDPRIKFAILKRATQLTAKRIPDPVLSNAKTLDHLLHALATKEPPKKLHETLVRSQALSATPNIQVHDSRRTHVHREKAIGRWKLIEEELMLRDMPIRGGSGVGVGRGAA